ncbi:MerC domain-containing protein [Aquirufa lenticrescens]|uniref:MerC domain-containing protein n=1 Tax=Aquirufa lenticrescens TaxID=2696560 RepID=UPI001CAA6055|nr:MerC domain-containing protein [Aquirufa lenticrescens]UAJ13190.1 MerC domain-containing protein [Aquirufa lenticrescens]
MSNKKYKHLLPVEKVGVFLSLLCAIHCLALPLILFAAPYLASSIAFSPMAEWVLVIGSFGMALLLLWQDFRKHRKPMPLYFLGLAVLIKLVDTLVGMKSIEWIFGLSLGVFITLAYWFNYKHKTACTCKIK